MLLRIGLRRWNVGNRWGIVMGILGDCFWNLGKIQTVCILSRIVICWVNLLWLSFYLCFKCLGNRSPQCRIFHRTSLKTSSRKFHNWSTPSIPCIPLQHQTISTTQFSCNSPKIWIPPSSWKDSSIEVSVWLPLPMKC